jgi:hypothetical protein
MQQKVETLTNSFTELKNVVHGISARLEKLLEIARDESQKEIMIEVACSLKQEASDIVNAVRDGSQGIRDALQEMAELLERDQMETPTPVAGSSHQRQDIYALGSSMSSMIVLLTSIDLSLRRRRVVVEQREKVDALDGIRFWKKQRWYRSWGKYVFKAAWWIGIGVGVGMLNWHGVLYRRFKDDATVVSERLHLVTGLGCLWVLIGKLMGVINK